MATQAELNWVQQNQQLAQQMGLGPQSPDGAVANYVKSWYDQQGANAPAPDATDSAVFQSVGVFPNNAQAGTPQSVQSQVNQTAANLFGGNDNPVGAAVNATLEKGATGAATNPNTQQVQGSSQAGSFNTTGNTSTTGTQQQTGSQQSTQNTAQQQTGTTNQTQTGAQQQTGQTQQAGVSAPIDTLGLGALLAAQKGNAQQATGVQQGFLTNLIQNGPANQQALTSQAVNQALSGPGMVGAGEGAQARAAGNAAAQVGTNALGQQLQAASQLAGPTASTTLANAGAPFIGQATANTGLNNTSGTNTNQTAGTTTGSTTGQSNSLNLTDLLNKSNTSTNESQAGQSAATGAQIGIGQSPTQQQSTSGGCYVCTAYVTQGKLMAKDVSEAARWKLGKPKYRRSLVGYSIYGPALARLVLHSRLFATIFFPLAHAVLRAELALSKSEQLRLWDRVCHAIFDHGSRWLAVLTGRTKVKQCNTEMTKMLVENNLNFTCS